tara:strand:+ start:580 stop:777 length:198 start_codon:yes stop_codon:yes gene_type:complete
MCYGWFSSVSVQQTTDGGYLIRYQQLDVSASNFHSNLIKTDALGNNQREREFGDIALADWGYSVQ